LELKTCFLGSWGGLVDTILKIERPCELCCTWVGGFFLEFAYESFSFSENFGTRDFGFDDELKG
jgi:hypothetical protein